MKKSLLLLALVLWTGMQAVIAQSRTVSGTVLDENGEPLPAVSVKVSGTETGTITGMDGTFQISIPEGARPELQIDAVGYSRRSISVESQESVTVNMQISSSSIDEVMIIGYGETTKEKYVGAADKIDAEQIEKFPVANITRVLEGAAPGVQVTNGGGQPGQDASVRIRGFGSLSASAAPLYVVDGAPWAGDITSINPMDIEQVTILKDATATSLYGSRAANGVVMITTKRGRTGQEKAQVKVDGKFGFITRAIPNYDVMKDESEYYETIYESYVNSLVASGAYSPEQARIVAAGQLPGEPGIVDLLGGYNSYNVPDDEVIDPATGKLNPNASLLYHDDWDDEVARTGFRQDYNLSVSGGSQKTDYYFSGGYLNEKGFIKHTGYERLSGRMNVNTQVTDWLRMGLNLNGSYGTYNRVTNGGTSGGYNPHFVSRDFAPIYPVYYYDSLGNREIDPLTGEHKYDWGSLGNAPESSIGTRASLPNANVLGSMDLDEENNLIGNVNAVPYIEASFLKHFKFKTLFSGSYQSQYSTDYNNPYYGQFSEQGGISQKTSQQMFFYTFNQQLSYNRNFGLHHVDAALIHESYALNLNQVSATRAGIAFPGNTNLAGAATPIGSTSFEDNHRIESYIGLVNYDFDSKYFFSASLRFDGSSRLSPDTRWGDPFYAVGASWMINREEFLKDVTWLDMLKVKVSYGTQGNERFGNYYMWQSLYDLTYPNGSNAGALISGVGNPALTWEQSAQLNAGIEFALFRNRISGEVNYFDRRNNDILYNLPMPLSSGIATRPANTMDMANRGVEIALNGDIIRKKDFNWNVGVNLTHFKNVITKMPEGQDTIYNGVLMYTKGHSIYDYYLLESFVNDSTGYEEYYYYNEEGERVSSRDYADALDNGRAYRGSSVPDLTGSLRSSFAFKGFDLSFLVSFGIGGENYDRIYASTMNSGVDFGSNWHRDILNRWTPDNPTSEIPKVEWQDQFTSYTSNRFLIDASYLNIRNISLGYTFSDNLVKKAGLTSARIYASADNVWLFSKRQGLDPQGTFSGVSDYIYTPARTIVFGLTLGL